jgi:hypothetical protein
MRIASGGTAQTELLNSTLRETHEVSRSFALTFSANTAKRVSSRVLALVTKSNFARWNKMESFHMTIETWQLIDASFLRWPQSKATVVDANEFDMAMQGYDPIDADYRDFVLRYGGAIVGSSPIYGLRKAEFMALLAGKPQLLRLQTGFEPRVG